MSNFAGGPSYQLSTKRNQGKNANVCATDGIRVQIADTFRIQTVKMPDYSRFASNVLTFSNDYTFSLENSVLTKYQAEDKAAVAPPKIPERPPPPAPVVQQDPTVRKETPVSYPPMPSGGLLRPSAADYTPRNSGTQENGGSTSNSGNEWADFERSRDLFDDLELKSIDDRHELARVLVSDHRSESQPNTPHRDQSNNNVPPNAPSVLTSLVDEHKKLSLSDNNLSATPSSAPGGGRISPVPPPPAPPGPSYSSATDLSSSNKLTSSNNLPTRLSGLPRYTPSVPPPPQPSPTVQLSAAQKAAVEHTAAMGFDCQLCSRLAHDLDTDSEEVLANAVLAHSSIVTDGFTAEKVERALVLVGGDERKARNVLGACSYLDQFGFNQTNVFAAVARLHNDKASQQSPSIFSDLDELRDKLLDILTADNAL